MDIPGTQLADSKPRVNQALRVSIPVNVPQRIPALIREKYIFKYAFSPNAFVITKKHTLLLAEQHKEEFQWIDTDLHSPPIPNLSLLDIDHDALIKTAAKDFSVLSQSNKRAGKRDIEATSFASLAVVQDNQFQYLHAIEGYKAYLQICDEIGDIVGAAAACNNIGVDYMLLAVPMSDAGFQSNVKPHPDVVGYLEQAIVYHQKHLDLGPDSGGRFVANTNLGLCYGMLQNINRAAKHQQDALRISIKMQSLHGQCMAVGNLGILALMKRDFATTRSCFDQHMQLVQSLVDCEAEIGAWIMLASLSEAQEAHADALDSLEQCRKIAERENFLNELRRIHCYIGISQGNINFKKYAQNVNYRKVTTQI